MTFVFHGTRFNTAGHGLTVERVPLQILANPNCKPLSNFRNSTKVGM